MEKKNIYIESISNAGAGLYEAMVFRTEHVGTAAEFIKRGLRDGLELRVHARNPEELMTLHRVAHGLIEHGEIENQVLNMGIVPDYYYEWLMRRKSISIYR